METIHQKPKKLLKLKPKEKEFVKTLVRKNNENITKTVQEVYGVEDQNYANVKGQRLIRKDTIVKAIQIEKETLKSALEKQGITPEKIALKIDELLEASEPIYKNNNSTGEIELVGEKIDFNSRDKGIKHALSIHGIEDQNDKPKTQNTYNFIFSKEVQDQIKATNEIIKRKLIANESNQTS